MELFFRTSGEGENNFIIIHGLYGCSDNWLSFSKKMDNCKVWLPDLRNHGKSNWSNEMNFKIMAEDINDFISTNKISSPIIMGHSMGGKVAMAFNYLFPEISKNLIILDVSPKAYNENDSNVIEHKKILKSLNEIDLSKFNDRSEIYKELIIKLESETLARFMLKNITRTNNCFAWKINVNSLLNNIDSIMGEALPLNTKTDIACLFVKAEKSDYLKESDYKVINSIYRRNSIRRIKNTSHWLHIENPNGLLKEIKEFINKK